MTKNEFVASHTVLTAEFHAEAAGLRAEVAALKEWKAEQKGKASTTSVIMSTAIAVAGLLVSLLTLLHNLTQ